MENSAADIVVHGKIFTSEGNQIVEAFAVKDGKFIYVGDKKGVENFIEEGKTEIIDYTSKSHAHYSICICIPKVGTAMDRDSTHKQFLKEIIPAAVTRTMDTGATSLLIFGWQFKKFDKNMLTQQQLDELCSDIPIYFTDEECHKWLVNAGIISADRKVLKKEIRGEEIVFDEDGKPTSFGKEQAGTYTRSFLDSNKLFTVDIAKEFLVEIQQKFLSESYTMYIDGWNNSLYNESYYKAVQEMDNTGDLNLIAGLAYEIESWMDIDKNLDKALEVQKYTSEHVKTNWIKLFIDGTVETGTGFIEPLYTDGHQGTVNWTEAEVTEITRKSNDNGLSMHIHTMGNADVNSAVNAYVNGGRILKARKFFH